MLFAWCHPFNASFDMLWWSCCCFQWSVFHCGHCYCMDCVRLMADHYAFGGRNRSLRCAVCRQTTLLGDISYVCARQEAQEDEIRVKVSRVPGKYGMSPWGSLLELLNWCPIRESGDVVPNLPLSLRATPVELGSHIIVPVPVKPPWRTWVNISLDSTT